METKTILEKTASELNEEILDLDVKTIDLKTTIQNITEDKKVIENNVIVKVRADKENFKNETDRKIEIEKQLEANLSYKAIKEQINVLEIQVISQEVRKKFLERELRIKLAQDKKLERELTETSLEIRKGDKERIRGEKRLEEIGEKQEKIKMEINVEVMKKQEEYKQRENKEMPKTEIQKFFIEQMNNNKEFNKLMKEAREIQDRQKEIEINRAYLERKIMISAISKGVRL